MSGGLYLGIDAGGTHVRSASWTEGEAAPSFHGTRPLPGDYAGFVDELRRAAREACAAGDGRRQLAAIGLGLPGRVEAGRAVWMPNVPYLDGRDVAADLSHACEAPVTVANDGQLALLGEARFGAARDVADTALVVFGTGIGGALMRNRRIVRGVHGTAGAFGWMRAWRGRPEEPSSDAQRGPWERQASGTALAELASALRPPLEPSQLSSAARGGREDARALLEHYTHDVGAGLAAIASVLDPERILISGGAGELIAELLPGVRAAMAAWSSPSTHDVELHLATHGARAGAFGAAALAHERKGAFLE